MSGHTGWSIDRKRGGRWKKRKYKWVMEQIDWQEVVGATGMRHRVRGGEVTARVFHAFAGRHIGSRGEADRTGLEGWKQHGRRGDWKVTGILGVTGVGEGKNDRKRLQGVMAWGRSKFWGKTAGRRSRWEAYGRSEVKVSNKGWKRRLWAMTPRVMEGKKWSKSRMFQV